MGKKTDVHFAIVNPGTRKTLKSFSSMDEAKAHLRSLFPNPKQQPTHLQIVTRPGSPPIV